MWFVKNPTIETGYVVNKPHGITVNGVQYPRNIFTKWSKAELAAIGVLPYAEGWIDKRYYNQGALSRVEVDGEVVGTYAAIAKDTDTLKAAMLTQVKSQVSSLQGAIDWYWSRAAKGGKAVPSDVQTYADAIYTEMEAKETAINALSTLDDIIAYENKPHVETRKVKHTAEDGTETYGPETQTFNRDVNMVMQWPTNPNDEVDPAFVSLVEA